MWSHVWEMENLERDGIPVTHGHKVAMGTLAGAAFTECVFAKKPQAERSVPSWAQREAEVRRTFAHLPAALPAVLKTARDKFIEDPLKVRRLREAVLDGWEAMKAALEEQIPPYGELRALLKNAGCPVDPGETGLTRRRIIAAARSAQMIRKRFTVLDLAYETGVFEDALDRMEASGEYLA
jgi:glycerol-1-phosphate dehydrogenase [NAD(P)+]